MAPVFASSRDGRSDDQPEIVSSQQELSVEEEPRGIYRQKRNIILTVTATITAYSFTPTTVVKNFILAASQAAGVDGKGAGLSCLPPGFTVC